MSDSAGGQFPALLTASSLAGIDYNRIECIQRKRLLAFVNHFVGQTVDFLSKFASRAEARLQEVALKIQRLEAEVTLLERKLNSVPELGNAATKSVTFREPPKDREEESLDPFVKMLRVGIAPDAVKQKMLISNIDLKTVEEFLHRNSL